MDDKMLLFIVENFTDHKDPRLRKEAVMAWDLLKARGIEIEKALEEIPMIIPKDAKSEQELLEEMLEKIHREYPEEELFLKQAYKDNH